MSGRKPLPDAERNRFEGGAGTGRPAVLSPAEPAGPGIRPWRPDSSAPA